MRLELKTNSFYSSEINFTKKRNKKWKIFIPLRLLLLILVYPLIACFRSFFFFLQRIIFKIMKGNQAY